MKWHTSAVDEFETMLIVVNSMKNRREFAKKL